MKYPLVERSLEKAVNALETLIPSLIQVRVFGSYNNGDWNPEKSDIDLFVLARSKQFNPDTTMSRSRFLEQELHLKFEELMKGTDERFHVCIMSPDCLRAIFWKDRGRGPIGIAMTNGRLLYPERGFARIKENLLFMFGPIRYGVYRTRK